MALLTGGLLLCSSAALGVLHWRIISLEASVKWFKFLIKMLTSIKEASTFSVTDIARPSPEVFHKPFIKCLCQLSN